MIWFICPYFGTLPNYFPLWLRSCGRNTSFRWLVITDQSVPTDLLPPNVRWEQMSLGELVLILETFVGISLPRLEPKQAYKLCDYRPAYSAILKHFRISADYWGHCDFDVVFGNLSKFITSEILNRYDKLFTFGHLTIYRNSPIANRMYRLGSKSSYWRKVFSSSENFGFDEHSGVSEIWEELRLPIYENENIVADIHTSFDRIMLTNIFQNRHCQLMACEDGGVFQLYSIGGKCFRREFAYIHLQKRRMEFAGLQGMSDYVVLPHKFLSYSRAHITDAQLLERYGSHWIGTPGDLPRFLKATIRYLKQGFHTSK